MLGGKNDVFESCGFEQLNPLFGVELFGLEPLVEIIVSFSGGRLTRCQNEGSPMNKRPQPKRSPTLERLLRRLQSGIAIPAALRQGCSTEQK